MDDHVDLGQGGPVGVVEAEAVHRRRHRRGGGPGGRSSASKPSPHSRRSRSKASLRRMSRRTRSAAPARRPGRTRGSTSQSGTQRRSRSTRAVPRNPVAPVTAIRRPASASAITGVWRGGLHPPVSTIHAAVQPWKSRSALERRRLEGDAFFLEHREQRAKNLVVGHLDRRRPSRRPAGRRGAPPPPRATGPARRPGCWLSRTRDPGEDLGGDAADELVVELPIAATGPGASAR